MYSYYLRPYTGELCGLRNLRELDLDGSHYSGPFPDWILSCFSVLQELDLSYNRVSVICLKGRTEQLT